MSKSFENPGASSRVRFIAQLASGAASLSVLAACSRGTTSLLPTRTPAAVLPFRDTPEIQALLYKQGLLAVREKGIAIIRDDMKSNPAFVKHAVRPAIIYCGTGIGCNNGNNSDQFTIELDGVPVSTVSTFTLGSGGGPCGLNLSTALYISSSTGWFDLGAGSLLDSSSCPASPYYGPIYSVPKPIACGNEIAGSIKTLATLLVGAALNTLQSKYGQGIVAVVTSARGFLAGTVSLAGFCDVLISALGAATLGEVLLDFAIGVTVGAILAYLACLIWPGGL